MLRWWYIGRKIGILFICSCCYLGEFVSAITFFKTYVVGNQQPVGASLVRLLEAQRLIYQDFDFSSLAELKQSSIASSFMVIAPSIYQLEQLRYLPGWLEQANRLNIPVIFVSSLAVFPEVKDKLWREDDSQYDQTELAQAFLQAEQQVQVLKKHIILRAGLPLYLDNHDFASRFLQAVRSQENWQLNSQSSFSPTTSNDLAQTIMAVMQQVNCADGLWGTYHCAGVESVSAFQFGQALLEQARHYEDIPEVMISAAEEAGEKPKLWVPNGDNTKLFHVFGIRPKAWRQGLTRLYRAALNPT